MKNLILFSLSVFLFLGCSTSQTQKGETSKTAVQQDVSGDKSQVQKECKINKYKCWDVAKLFKLGSKYTEEERNAKLKKMGLSVTYSTMYRDGGSWSYQLSDGTNIFVVNSLWDRSGDLKIRPSGGGNFVYTSEGKLKP